VRCRVLQCVAVNDSSSPICRKGKKGKKAGGEGESANVCERESGLKEKIERGGRTRGREGKRRREREKEGGGEGERERERERERKREKDRARERE